MEKRERIYKNGSTFRSSAHLDTDATVQFEIFASSFYFVLLNVDESSEQLNAWNSGGMFGCETVIHLMYADDLGALSSPSGLTEGFFCHWRCRIPCNISSAVPQEATWLSKLTQNGDGAENFVMVSLEQSPKATFIASFFIKQLDC